MKIDRNEYINFLKDFLQNFSPSGRDRILNDLKKTNSQILCKKDGRKSISEIGSPTVVQILKDLEIFNQYEDQNIDWQKTEGVNYKVLEGRKAVKHILIKLEKYSNDKYDIKFRHKLFSEIGLQKESMLNKLSILKYKSKTPGSRLVSKQNNHITKQTGLTDEHVIPIKYQRKEFLKLIDSNKLEEEIDLIFSKLIMVKLNTDDDEKINQMGFKSTMPPNWTWNDDPLERYWQSGIDPNSLEEIK
jgi:hypothetical protein